MREIWSEVAYIDLMAPLWLLVCWLGYSSFARSEWARTHSLMSRVHEYRVLWLRRMIRRDNHISDIQVIHALMRTVSFVAQTTLFIVAGAVATLGARETMTEVLVSMPMTVAAPPVVLDAKILILVVIFIYAFFKCTWSLRQYNYASIMIGAAPEGKALTADAKKYVERTARTLTIAAEHFNKSIRAFYFGLASLSWFINPLLFMALSTWVLLIIFRREFKSKMLHNLGPVGAPIDCSD